MIPIRIGPRGISTLLGLDDVTGPYIANRLWQTNAAGTGFEQCAELEVNTSGGISPTSDGGADLGTSQSLGWQNIYAALFSPTTTGISTSRFTQSELIVNRYGDCLIQAGDRFTGYMVTRAAGGNTGSSYGLEWRCASRFYDHTHLMCIDGGGPGAIWLHNTFPASASSNQVANSPILLFSGSGYYRTPSDVQQDVDFSLQCVPLGTAGAGPVKGNLEFRGSINASPTAGTLLAYLTEAGTFHVVESLRVAGDEGTGLAGAITFTNVISTDTTGSAPTNINTPSGIGAAQSGWLKIIDGTTVKYLQVWG